MRSILAVLTFAVGVAGANALAQDREPAMPRSGAADRSPPPQAYADCAGKQAGATVQHATPEGRVAATCEQSPQGLVARPVRPREAAAAGAQVEPPAGAARRGAIGSDRGQKYSLEQAISDQAQLNTIAFDALAFLTGNFAYDTFLPPGKVSDYFGFQYLRDIDAREGGHNTSFLTRIADNVLAILDDGQRARLLALAKEQEADIRRFAEMRLPLIKAFRQNLEGALPAGSAGLSRQAVVQYSGDLYALDGRLSYRRAQVMASVVRSLDEHQQAMFSKLGYGDSGRWPVVGPALDRRTLSHESFVAVMTYASEMFSWRAGSLAADTYFCPERHGMYFGGFGMKTAPAMGKRDHSISTTLTADGGEGFLGVLTETQRRQITALVGLQRQDLAEIVRVRRAIASELRRFLDGGAVDRDTVLALSRRYGELDGELSYLYATAFARVGQSLTARQRQTIGALRPTDPQAPKGPFLYSTPVETPGIGSTDAFFGVRS